MKFRVFGLLTSNPEFKLLLQFVERTYVPCFLCLRRNKFGELQVVGLIELNNENLIEEQVILPLLNDVHAQFKDQFKLDQRFLQNFNEKTKLRRQIISGNAPFMDQQQMASPTHRNPREEQRQRIEQEKLHKERA